ncbi:Oidioi.mRNA.OKI2018_I69.XSR.g16731.t1.cds [Oikopleura dioica]|uniref:Oidioi.mRNA.OKI2018_I69.XSR.g16731.t1.cds n=1 Tax=Oikopleura dioica TaxID=34765 RepID=A0ABN7SM74_OIKDI|nr:Oidioi.mRNA.OKI2018_I69.XSR.g16731.t1.cds [Oikopleura dioica]
MTSRDLHQAIIDGNFTTGRRYIGRCSMVFRGKKACHVACGDTYTKRGTTTVQFLESLESNGADLEDPDEDGFTTLLLAALFHCDPGPVVAFLNSKVPAVVDKTDKTGRNALHLLALNEKLKATVHKFKLFSSRSRRNE